MRQPLLTTLKARELAGKHLEMGGQRFVFDDDIKSGGQAFAMPLKNTDGKRIAFFRSLTATSSTPKMKHRTAWMIGQRLHLLSEVFVGAPQLWVDTEKQQRPEGIEFDFAGTIHGIALGSSWKSWKEDIEMGLRNEPAAELRIQFAEGLIQRLACLESVGSSGFIHGDISDANVMLDDATGKTNLIDFDCFVFQSPTLEQTKLLIRDGGSKGTPGYIPDWLCKDPSKDLAPLGDRFARDMLLVEILGFREGDPIELSPLYWTEQEDLLDDIKRLSKRLELPHLQEMKVFEASESERPSSFELAERLGLSIDNNVQQTLDAPPVWPAESAGADSHDPVLGETKSSLRSSISVPIELPTCEELPQFLTKQADRAVIELGKAVLPLLKAVGIGLAGIALTVIWVMVLVWLLLNLALPANLIACGGMIYGTHFLWERPELLKKYLHLD